MARSPAGSLVGTGEDGALAAGTLPTPDEPVSLREQTRRAVLEEPGSWSRISADGTWIADAVWAQWAAVLEPRGTTRDLVAAGAAEHRYELWLWVMGERTWAQTASGLAGRSLRRLGSKR